jgi:transcriptional regulator with XRE-family HTH domain
MKATSPGILILDADGIGPHVAEARKLRGLTQDGLALLIPCSKSLVSQVERGTKPATPWFVAAVAATADVEVTLDITPRVPHVFQAYYPILDEAAAALDRAGQLLSAHVASAERVTA